MIDYYLENIRLGGSGPENYQKTLRAFRDVTTDVMEEIADVEQLPEIDLAKGVSKAINCLNELYPGMSSFIIDRVIEQVGSKRRRPVYDVVVKDEN